ncbi:hypothetical protein MSMAS_1119 [Methanosarcina mazei S-6]|uniref:Uncharacterized protein n=2 Tax=Methanosarcina mazei TaxID=2209 RepID=M1Q669_METMZ|nr:hypothetical protein MmTuc01_0190 [Methanosarcina mazei Tuc01]AKB64315.1 hypothetical protein MSMAS_1119 [Methanosarcina mazei S-6]
MKPRNPSGGARNYYISVHVCIPVLCKMIPADHVCKRVTAMGLRVKFTVPFEKFPVGKSDRLEIFLTEHQGTPEFRKWDAL